MSKLSIEYVYKPDHKAQIKELAYCRYCIKLRSRSCTNKHVNKPNI